MDTTANAHLIEIPTGGNGGEFWRRLHSEREDVCEAMVKDCQSTSGAAGEASRPNGVTTANWHRELLQARLRKIDDALDRLMSGSYGHCSNCGRWIGDGKLEFDPTIAFCGGCWKQKQKETPNNLSQDSSRVGDSNATSIASSPSELTLEELQPFDTILVQTLNSDYRILLLDPKTGRALVEGGQYLIEPSEAFLSGSTLHGSQFRLGSIAVGYHLELRADGKNVRTSRVESARVVHLKPADSLEAITAALQ